jgi:hypothetical protein
MSSANEEILRSDFLSLRCTQRSCSQPAKSGHFCSIHSIQFFSCWFETEQQTRSDHNQQNSTDMPAFHDFHKPEYGIRPISDKIVDDRSQMANSNSRESRLDRRLLEILKKK